MEDDRLPVGRPGRPPLGPGVGRQLADASAVRVHDVDVVAPASIASECDPLPIWRPGGRDVLGRVVGEVRPRRPIWVHAPDIGRLQDRVALTRVDHELRTLERDASAVWAPRRGPFAVRVARREDGFGAGGRARHVLHDDQAVTGRIPIKGDPGPVGRPGGSALAARAAPKQTLPASVGVHQIEVEPPTLAAVAVCHEGDLLTVGREGRIGLRRPIRVVGGRGQIDQPRAIGIHHEDVVVAILLRPEGDLSVRARECRISRSDEADESETTRENQSIQTSDAAPPLRTRPSIAADHPVVYGRIGNTRSGSRRSGRWG